MLRPRGALAGDPGGDSFAAVTMTTEVFWSMI